MEEEKLRYWRDELMDQPKEMHPEDILDAENKLIMIRKQIEENGQCMQEIHTMNSRIRKMNKAIRYICILSMLLSLLDIAITILMKLM